jgi:hypothetical protein
MTKRPLVATLLTVAALVLLLSFKTEERSPAGPKRQRSIRFPERNVYEPGPTIQSLQSALTQAGM